MSETQLKEKCFEAFTRLKQQGRRIKWVKYHGSAFSKASTPDVHVTLDGQSYWIELKRPGETPTPGQWQEIREWAAAGAVSSWADSVDGVLRILGITTGAT